MGERAVKMRASLAGLGGGTPLLPLIVLFGLNAVDELDRGAFSTLLPEIREHFGLNLTGVTSLAAAIVPAALLVGFPIARLADKHRRVPIAIAGAIAWGLFSVFTGLVPSVLLLGVARIGAGLGRAVNDPVHGSLLSDYYPPRARTKVFGFHRSANTVGAFFGPLIAGFMATAIGWRVPFVVLAVPTFLLILLAVTRLHEPARTGLRSVEGDVSFSHAFRILWGIGSLRRIWLAFPFISFFAIALSQIMSLYYDEIFGVNAAGRGVIQSFDAPFIVLGLVVGSPIIDRGMHADPGRVMKLIGLAVLCVGAFILGIAVAPALWMAVVFTYAINVLGTVLYAGGFALVSLVAPPEVRASAFAFFSISSLLGVIALPMVGIVGDAIGLRWGLAFLIPMVVIGSAILASAGRFVNEDILRVNPDGLAATPEPHVIPPPSPPGPAE
jgi:MFS family permease